MRGMHKSLRMRRTECHEWLTGEIIIAFRRSNQPVFDVQAWNPGKMVVIAGDQRQLMRNGNGPDLDVGPRKRHAPFFQIGSNLACDVCRPNVKIENRCHCQKDPLKVFQVKVGPVAFPGAVHHLRNGNA